MDRGRAGRPPTHTTRLVKSLYQYPLPKFASYLARVRLGGPFECGGVPLYVSVSGYPVSGVYVPSVYRVWQRVW